MVVFGVKVTNQLELGVTRTYFHCHAKLSVINGVFVQKIAPLKIVHYVRRFSNLTAITIQAAQLTVGKKEVLILGLGLGAITTTAYTIGNSAQTNANINLNLSILSVHGIIFIRMNWCHGASTELLVKEETNGVLL